MKKLVISLFTGLLLLGLTNSANALQLFGSEYTWHYNYLNDSNYFNDSNLADRSSNPFPYSAANWSGFESWPTAPVISSGAGNASDYLLKTIINIGNTIPTDLYVISTLSPGDRFKLFINGNSLDVMEYYAPIGGAYAVGMGLNPHLFNSNGINDISIFLDYTGTSNNIYFDLQLSSNFIPPTATPAIVNIPPTIDVPYVPPSTPVPEPSTVILGLMSLCGLLGFNRKTQQ